MNSRSREVRPLKRPVRYTLLAAVLAGSVASGCRTGDNGSVERRQINRPVPVNIQNNNFLDIAVFATSSGSRIKLGQVTGKSSGTFRIHPRRLNMVAGLQIMVDPLGSAQTYLSPVVFPGGAETVVLTVANILDRSYITVR